MRLIVIAVSLISLMLLVLVEVHVIHASGNHTTSLPEARDVFQNSSYLGVLLSRVESYLSNIGERLTLLSELVSSSIERIKNSVSILVISIRGLVSEAREILGQIIKGGDFRFTVSIMISTRREEVKYLFELYLNRGVIDNMLSTMSIVLERLSGIIRDFMSMFIGTVLFTSSTVILTNRTVESE